MPVVWLLRYTNRTSNLKTSLTRKYHIVINFKEDIYHWGKADDRNCNYGHPKMVDVESGKNLFCRLNCFYNVF